MSETLRGLFVVGTDTGVGKTRVAAAIARSLKEIGHSVGVMKPVATGATRVGEKWECEDTEILHQSVGGTSDIRHVTPIHFGEPLAPPVAARRAGTLLTFDRVVRAVSESLAYWSEIAEILVVEGVGGLLCPLAEGATVADLAVLLDYPLLVVARRGLGTLNHTLMTVEAARSRGLRVAGLILNGSATTTDPVAEATNAEELSRRLEGVALLAELPWTEDPASLVNGLRAVDWSGLAMPPRLTGGLEVAFASWERWHGDGLCRGLGR